MSLRVAMLTTFYPPYNFGGDGVGVQRLARAFAGRGWDVTVIHEEDAYLALAGKAPQPSPPDDQVKTIGLRSRLGVASNLLTHQLGRPVVHHAKLNALLAPGAFDLIWYNNVSLIGGPGLLAYGDGLKVYEAHEHWLVCPTHVLWRHNREVCDGRECLRCVASYRRPPQLWRHSGLLERQLENIDLFVAKSEFSRHKHQEFGFQKPMSVIPYFLPDLDGTETPSERPQEKPYFLFVGRLEKIKGVQDIIPAFEGEEGPDLLIIGAGDYEAELRDQAKGSPRIKFVGRLNPEELARYYAHATALIVPSVCYETFGIILIEAFRNGAPVIARRLGPFPEIVARGGGVTFSDLQTLKAAMAELEQPRRRDALAMQAKAAFAKEWSQSAVMKRYDEALAGAALATGRKGLLKALGS